MRINEVQNLSQLPKGKLFCGPEGRETLETATGGPSLPEEWLAGAMEALKNRRLNPNVETQSDIVAAAINAGYTHRIYGPPKGSGWKAKSMPLDEFVP